MRELKRISYSFLHTFACPYAAFLRYEAAIKLKVTDSLALGNALHLALELSHKQSEWKLDYAVTEFQKEFKRIIEEDDVFISWPKMKKMEAEGIEMLSLYYTGLLSGQISKTPTAVEEEFELPFENEIVVVGKIDKREDEEDGEYTITDYKSGKYEPDAWFLRHDLQFTTYAWAGYEKKGKLPRKLRWHHLRTGKILETERTMEDVEELKTMMHNALEMNRNSIRYRVYHSQVCKWCDFKGAVCDDRELEKSLVKQREALKVTEA